MNFPQTVRIAGIDVSISVSGTSDYAGASNAGVSNMQDGVIWINGGLPEWQQRKTLLHELIHCISSMFCPGADLSEQQVLGIENGMWALLHDNPGLADLFAAPVAPSSAPSPRQAKKKSPAKKV